MDSADLRKLLARNLRVLAKRRGMTLNALGDFAGVSRAQVFAVLAETTAPTIDWLAKVAEALEVEPWQLLSPAEATRRGRPGS